MCGSCGHAVRDFRTASDVEILAAHAETGRTCGVYTRRQLVQGGGATPEPPRGFVRQLAAWSTAIMAFGLADGAVAQTPPAPVFTAATNDLSLPSRDAPDDSVFVSGRVVEADYREPLPGANVVATTSDGRTVGVATDIDGLFRLNVTPLRGGGETTAVVRVAYVGFQASEFEVSLLQSTELMPQLCGDFELTGVVIVVNDPEPWSLWGWLRRTLGV